MACTGEINYEGLKHSSRYLALPNRDEESMLDAHRLITPYLEKALNNAWEADKKGKKTLANKYYKGGNYIYYIAMYASIISNYLNNNSNLYTKCTAKDIEEKYSLVSFSKCLLCLSKKYNIDYISIWNELLEIYSIEVTEECLECCPGIGQMIIEEESDCFAFIIGNCEDNLAAVPPYGEFALCEFPPEEFSEPEGENLYIDCN